LRLLGRSVPYPITELFCQDGKVEPRRFGEVDNALGRKGEVFVRKIPLVMGLLALVAPSLFTVSAQAQATRTWISGVGDDANPCSRTAPCKTFPGAISKTATGGEIDTLDPGGFGAITVTKAITLADEGVGEGGILVAGTNGITVNCSTDPNCVVVVRGLQIDGGPLPTSNSLAGIKFIAGGALQVQNCVIRNFNGGSPNGYGISFTPNTTAKLEVSDSVISTNGQFGSANSGIGAGIYVAPTSGGGAVVSVTRVQLLNNTNGFRIDETLGATSAVTATIQDSVIDGSGVQGIAVVTGAATPKATLVLDRDTSSNNGVDGVVSTGAMSNIYIGDTIVTGNLGKGVATSASGVLTTYKNNEINGNTNDNTAVMTMGGLQ